MPPSRFSGFLLLGVLFAGAHLTPAVLAGALLAPEPLTAPSEGACPEAGPDGLRAFEGSYGSGGPSSDAVVTFSVRRGTLLMHPALWSGPMVLRRATPDSFNVAAHPQFGAAFARDGEGCVVAARVRGLSPEGRYDHLDPEAPRPVQLLEGGRPREAARRYVASGRSQVDRLVEVGRKFVRGNPTRIRDAVAFFTELRSFHPRSAAVHAALGDALVFAGERGEAASAYERALELDPAKPEAVAGLRRLGRRAAGDDGGWRLSFPLDSLFAPPSRSEIDAVWARWRGRDLEPSAVRLVARHPVDLDGVRAEARVVEHTVHGRRHVGVVIVPEGAAAGSMPVLVEAKGVSPDFLPLEVPGGMTAPHVMAEARGRVVYAAPGYRGERVVVGGDTLTSEGDRSDAWDGATDDLIAFLRVALEVTPEADTSRVCVFGRSRGGAVALLSGMRETAIDCVVSWAAPTDWFRLMGLEGWTQRELVADGLRSRAAPGETGGQFIDYFLDAALAGRRDLRETRLHMIASSPLYFADRVPMTQVHWGLEDTIVPAANGRAFVARYEASERPGACQDVRFHPDAGHDQDRQLAPIWTRDFLLGAFGMRPGRVAACRPPGTDRSAAGAAEASSAGRDR